MNIQQLGTNEMKEINLIEAQITDVDLLMKDLQIDIEQLKQDCLTIETNLRESNSRSHKASLVEKQEYERVLKEYETLKS